jgi:hypothetical protein
MSNDDVRNGEVSGTNGDGHTFLPREGSVLLTMQGDTATRLAYQVQSLVLVADLLVMARRFFDSRGVEPAEQVRQLCEVSKGFDAIQAPCVHVDKALRDGGAKWLDSVTAPCASGRARSVQIRLAVDRLRAEVSRLSFQVEFPQHYRPDVLGAAATAALELEDYLNEMLAILKNRLGAPSDRPDTPPRTEAVELARGVGGGDSGVAKPPAPSAVVALTADHDAILAVLGKTPSKCLTVIDVSSAGTIRNRETVGLLLRQLAKIGLVHRPFGTKKGYALTDAGRMRSPGATPT